MSTSPIKCSRCPRLQDIPKFSTKANGLTTWQNSCSTCSTRRPTTTNIRYFYQDISRQVGSSKREAERHKRAKKHVEAKAVVELLDSPEDYGWEAIKQKFRPFANGIAQAVREKTEWAFTCYRVEMSGTGPKYSFRCSQDSRNNRKRNGKKVGGGNKRARQTADRFGCRGELVINVDVGGEFARLRFTHQHHHFAYRRVQLSNSVEKEALRLIGDGVSKPSVLFQSLINKLDEKDQATITQNQIRSLVTRERNRKLGVDPKLLSEAKTMAEQVRLVMPKIKKLKLSSASDDGVWESFAWTIEPFNKLAAEAKELLFDGTHGTTAQDFEVVVCLAEKRSHSYPVALLALRPSKSRPVAARVKAQSRLEVIESFFDTIRVQQCAQPSVVHVDKDFSEISAIQRVWPTSSIHICLWHMKKAAERGLAQPSSEKGTRYGPEEVALFLPSVDFNFLPLNPKKPNRVLRDPYRLPTPEPVASSPSPPPVSPPPVVPLSPLSQFRAFLDVFAPPVPAPAPLDDEEAAERRRLEYDDEEEGPWEDTIEDAIEDSSGGVAEVDSSGGRSNVNISSIEIDEPASRTESLTAEERRNASQKRFRDDPTLPRALSDVRKKISSMMGLHSFRHPSIPTPQGFLTAQEHYLECLNAMYEFCYRQDLADAWAYLWENWYRPGRWELWTRASCAFVPILRTTMGAEAFFRALKNDWMGRRRTSLIGLLKLIGVDIVSHYERHLQRLHYGDLTQNFRLARSRWRYPFKRNERRVYRNEHHRRLNAAAGLNGVKNGTSQGTSASVPSSQVIRAPSFLPPVHTASDVLTTMSTITPEEEDTSLIDPALLALGPPSRSRPLASVPPLRTDHYFDPVLQVCSCPSFLQSRFLRCKHITLSTKQEVLGDGSQADEDLWFELVERHREPPFWRVPEAAKNVAIRRKEGIETTDEMWETDLQNERDEEEDTSDEDDDDNSIWGIGDESDHDDDGCDGEGTDTESEKGLENRSSSPVENPAKRARALSEPEELIDYASQDADRSQYYDNVSQSMAKLTSFIDSINEKEGDPRALRVCSKEIEKLRKKLEKGSSQTIGSGGLAGVLPHDSNPDPPAFINPDSTSIQDCDFSSTSTLMRLPISTTTEPIAAVALEPLRLAASPIPSRSDIQQLSPLKSFILESLEREIDDGDDGGWGRQWPNWPIPEHGDGGGGDGGGNYPTQPSFPNPPNGRNSDATLAILIPLIIVLTTLLFLIFLLIILLLKRRRGIVLSDEGGPTNLEREDLIDGEGGFEGVEERWLAEVEEPIRIGYQRAKDWQTQYPPNSQPTEITLSQFLSIQEKGVSAWSFEPDYESNPALIVQSRTEITFLADGFGMAPEEGGGCCVQSNLPLPKLNEVYYWECKMFEKPQQTNISIGLATKPFPSFRLPGWNKFSVGYHSADGFKSHNYPFTSTSYGPPILEGDTLGVGYRPRSGTVFFTRNGKKLEDAFIGFNKHNLFPTVGADGSCSIHVNLGQAGFVFIEANVKKWGLAPMVGSLAPPPAYGSERGSILLESANANASTSTSNATTTTVVPSTRRVRPGSPSSRLLPHSPPNRSHRSRRAPVPSSVSTTNLPPTPAGAATALASPSQPIRPSPLRHSRHASNLSNTSSCHQPTSDNGSNSPDRTIDAPGEREGEGEEEEEDVHNPPTPGLLDISLHSIHRFPDRVDESDEEEEQQRRRRRRRNNNGGGGGVESDEGEGRSEEEGDDDEDEDEEDGFDAEQTLEQRLLREVARERGETASTRSVSPPAYNPIDPHMYAPGVAETILEDAFSGPTGGSSSSPSSSSAQHHHQQLNPNSHHHQQSSSQRPSTSTHQNSSSSSFLAQLGLGFGSRTTGGAITLPTSGSGSSSPNTRGYENRINGVGGRGGIGNFQQSQSPLQGARGNAGAGSWFGWLAGNNQN